MCGFCARERLGRSSRRGHFAPLWIGLKKSPQVPKVLEARSRLSHSRSFQLSNAQGAIRIACCAEPKSQVE